MAYPESLKHIKTEEVLLLFRAADEASFYTSDIKHALDMKSLAQELALRNAKTGLHISKVYYSLIAARAYLEAQAWRRESNFDVDAKNWEVDGLIDQTRLQGVLSAGTAAVEFRPFAFPKGGFMLVIAHPQCHFSKYAMNDIHSDRRLMNAVSSHSMWMAPQQRESDPSIFRDWNAAYPNALISQAYLNAEWPHLDTWETPTFYFFSDGILKEKIVGWPREGRRTKLYQALHEIGIEVPPG